MPALRFYNRVDGRFADERSGLAERYQPTPFDRLVQLAPE